MEAVSDVRCNLSGHLPLALAFACVCSLKSLFALNEWTCPLGANFRSSSQERKPGPHPRSMTIWPGLISAGVLGIAQKRDPVKHLSSGQAGLL